MKLWKRNAVVAVIVLFVCAAVYLNWSYDQEQADTGKVLGQAALVDGRTEDPLLAEDGDDESAAQPAPDGGEDTASAGAEGDGDTGYFASARLNRQEARDSALSILQDSAGSESADETMKAEMTRAIETMASVTVSEAQIENLVTAKGYTDCVAFVNDDSASVVVASSGGAGLTATDIAKITEIVTGETGLTASQIKIIETEP
ncbi:SpoIIIAH-like family protein [Pseudoflavonifractor sp. MSJ-37]|uniref:SpoIIIAH-like family protein n=1 Tax=Pseudoflavonifractor sp. MSJ-37 TaxID=2841531 RepID=UPI001C112D98|nr:SpoIIIAH-like family protein [Pseudoflavonifractor sp. MSJ-37]MBU5434867.1 SpoIIIAH-like family protein [Pseudoflavonifractor sp. MSJ-37]